MSLILDCLYAIAGLLLLPYWLWKLPQAARYRAGILQRLGYSPRLDPGRKRLWIHCASVGEAAIPRRLVAELRERFPRWQIVFSSNTDTGAGRLRELYPGSPVFYMPLDFSFSVRRSLMRVSPDAVILVEMELWPNFILGCRSMGIPVAIINGRVGRGSRRLLGVLGRFVPRLWEPLQLCCARGSRDAAALRRAGLDPERIVVSGSLKYDSLRTEPDPAERARLGRLFNIAPDAPVLVAGSTHEGEETALAAAYRDLRLRHRRLRLIVAPRHIERAARVITTLQTRNLPAAAKTHLESTGPAADEPVVVVDTIGDLLDCYALATCVFVGRSLFPPGGGQNVMEPAGLGKPVLVGPYTGNFRDEVRTLVRAEAAVVVADRRELTEQVHRLLATPEVARRMGRAARAVVLQSQGATQRTLRHLEPILRAVGQG